jgi:formimidoylglutamate deiminase
MTTIFARKALLEDGWAAGVRLEVDDGKFSTISRDQVARADDVTAGIVIPGLVNAHSHAFQRVLAGHTEERGPTDKDNFWTWRSRMYALAGLVDASALHVIARQLYCEMVATGYTAVAEFHYLHNEPAATGPTDAMFEALLAAADEAGIRLTYIPVHYERAGFSEQQPTVDQQRFVQSCDEFLEHYARARNVAGENFQVGIGAHSLRAVSAESLRHIAATAKNDDVPLHIHIAEQKREVGQCLDVYGARPVEWLLDQHDVNESWCLVHATHMDDMEISALARSGAVVCLCPSTEANLGDGLFRLQPYLEQGGHIAIGSDSHVSINPFEELRWLEYGQRLTSQSRNVAAIKRQQTGRNLFELAVTGGAMASAKGDGQIRPGSDADLVVLDDDSPMLAGHTTRSLIDALVFSGFTLPIDRVMVNGKWQVEDGRHHAAEKSRAAYAQVANKLQAGGGLS